MPSRDARTILPRSQSPHEKTPQLGQPEPSVPGLNYHSQVDTARKIELIRERIDAAQDGMVQDWQGWRNKSEVVVRSIFGDGSTIHEKFTAVKYAPGAYTLGTDFTPYRQSGVRTACSIAEAGILELQLADEFDVSTEAVEAIVSQAVSANLSGSERDDIFIVHGHDETTKLKTSEFLTDLVKRPPIILHRQANKGRTLIEKFEDSADSAAYAVILATADDIGRAMKDTDLKPRARQNVVFEMGFFIGAIGRGRVAVLYDEDIEEVGDMKGIVYIALDKAGAWKSQLAKEIEASGITVEWSALGRH